VFNVETNVIYTQLFAQKLSRTNRLQLATASDTTRGQTCRTNGDAKLGDKLYKNTQHRPHLHNILDDD